MSINLPDRPDPHFKDKTKTHHKEQGTFQGKSVTPHSESSIKYLLNRLKDHPSEKIAPLHESRVHQPIVINFVEIKKLQDIESLKFDLSELKTQLETLQRPQFASFNFTQVGIEREIQVIGNRYVPVRRSEQQTIHQTIRDHGRSIGMDSPGLTLVVIEDAIFDQVMEELTHHSVMIPPTLYEREKTSSKVKEEEPQATVRPRREVVGKKSDKTQSVEWKNEVAKLMTKLVEEGKKTREKEKEEHQFLEKEAVIKYAILQYERLHDMVQKESVKKGLTRKQFDGLIQKWEESFPPFPIRAVNESVLWRELKPKMIEALLGHFGRL